MTVSGRKDLIADLVKLKYDLAVDMYQQRAKARSAAAASREGNPWEYAAYKIFGPSLIGGLALWLDPFWKFKVNPDSKTLESLHLTRVVPVNRTRTKVTTWANSITSHYYSESNSAVSGVVFTGTVYAQGPWTSSKPTKTVIDQQKAHQYPLYGFCRDTTFKSRNPGRSPPRSKKFRNKDSSFQNQGELEIWNPTFTSDTFSAGVKSRTYTWSQFFSRPLATITENSLVQRFSLSGASAVISPADVNAVLVNENLYARNLMNKHGASMVADCLVTRRRFNIGYQIGELKDLPQMLRGTLAVYKDIEHLIGWSEFKKALTQPSWWTSINYAKIGPAMDKLMIANRPDKALSSAYLTYKFGYESIYQALVKLLETPEKVTHDVNFLCSKNGKFQTFRRSRKFLLDEWAEVPPVEFQIPYPLTVDPHELPSSKGTRECQLRIVVESGVQLPNIVTPALRKELYYDKLGWPLRPSDYYNLIPWTWLADWFLSVNDYLKLLEEMHLDKSLINWGLVTYKSKLRSVGTCKLNTSTTDVTIVSPAQPISVTKLHSYTLSSEFKADYQLRIDAAGLANVNLTSGKGLSPTQGSILSALISQFT